MGVVPVMSCRSSMPCLVQVSLEGNSILTGSIQAVTGCRGCLLVCRGALEFIVQTIGSYRGIDS